MKMPNTTTPTPRYYLALLWPYALNLASLACLVYGIHLAIKIHDKPILAWDVPTHLSYQRNLDAGDVRVRHSRKLARYDADLWNLGIQVCGGLVAALTLVAFRYRRFPASPTTARNARVIDGILSRPSRSESSSAPLTGIIFDLKRKGLVRTVKDFGRSSSRNKMTLSSLMLWIGTIGFGAQTATTFFGMYPLTWTMTSPIGPVSTAAISDSLGFGVWVPAAAPWDLSAVMLRSAFEHVVSQKGPGALGIVHRHLSHHLSETADGAGVRIGKTVYPSLRTHGVGVAPAPWERKGYRLPSSAGGRVLGYRPVVAGTNVTVGCRDSTDDWNWEYRVVEALVPASLDNEEDKVVVHRFDLAPKVDWQTRGTNRTVTFSEDEGSRDFFVDTWRALKKIRETGGPATSTGSDGGTEEKTEEEQPETNDGSGSGSDESANYNEPTIHQLFFFTKFSHHSPVYKPSDPKVTVTLIDCQYGGRDLIHQVTMTSPIDPVSIGPVLATKDELTFDALIPAAEAIDEALNHAGRGGAMVAGMAAGTLTSVEMWDMFVHRTLSLPELIEHILTDTAQAYFSLVRQWREEALFLSWRKDWDFPEGELTVTTNKQVGGGGGGGVWMVLLAVLGMLAVSQLWGLLSFTRVLVDGVVGKSLAEQGLELRDGVIYRVKKKDD